MADKQPEALRLADGIADRRDWYEFDPSAWCPQASAMLIRQHALIAELVGALEHAKCGLLWYQDRYPEATDGSDDEAMKLIDASLAKAKEQQ